MRFSIVPGLFLLLSALQAEVRHPEIGASPAGRKIIMDCVDQIYNFNFRRAESMCREMAGQYPGHPAVDLLAATNQYWQWFPARSDKQLESQVRYRAQIASQNAARWMDTAGKDIPEAMFIYFSAEALLARMDNFAHATMASLSHAKNAYPFVKKSFAYQGIYPDFLLVAGLYNYYREEYVTIRPFYKSLVWFMKEGDKTRGIRQMKAASEKALFCRAEAAIYLAHVLTDYEKKPDEACPGLIRLSGLYPNNLYIKAKLAEMLLYAGKPDKALVYIQALLESRVPEYRVAGLVNKAGYDLQTGNTAEARAGAAGILDMGLEEESARAAAHRILAVISARNGQVSQAKKHYRMVRELTEYPILTDEADQYLAAH